MNLPNRVAAIDCGTNSIRLLIADLQPDGTLRDVARRMEVVRLGQGVDRTGELAPDALQRTLAMTEQYAAQIQESGANKVRFVATSATRDARNRADFVSGVKRLLGVAPEVVSGAEEAALSFRGATAVIGSGLAAPFLVVDLGGGSTELVLGTDCPQSAFSMDVGCVRMAERHLRSDPPTAAEIAGAQNDVRAALDEAERHVDLAATATLVGLAGTITTVTAHALGLNKYERQKINGAQLPASAILQACNELNQMPRAQRAALSFMHPGRVDVIGSGAVVWAEVVQRVQQRVAESGRELAIVTSEHDILDGIALSLS